MFIDTESTKFKGSVEVPCLSTWRSAGARKRLAQSYKHVAALRPGLQVKPIALFLRPVASQKSFRRFLHLGRFSLSEFIHLLQQLLIFSN